MKRKVISIISLIFMVICVFSVFSMPVFADDTESGTVCEVCGQTHNLNSLKGVNRLAYEMNTVVYGGKLFDEGKDGSLSTYDVLEFNTESTAFKSLWEKGRELYDLLVPAGVVLVIIMAFTSAMEMAVNELGNPEMVVKTIIKFIVGVLIVRNGYDIVTFCMQFASFVFGKLNVTPSNSSAMTTLCNFAKMENANFFSALGDIATMFVPYLILLAAKLLVSIICWVRVLDIITKTIFAPIGMADIINGTSSTGFRYMKKLIAAGLQGAVILAIVKAYGMVSSVISSTFAGWLGSVVLACVVITLMFKSSSISNEVMGV